MLANLFRFSIKRSPLAAVVRDAMRRPWWPTRPPLPQTPKEARRSYLLDKAVTTIAEALNTIHPPH